MGFVSCQGDLRRARRPKRLGPGLSAHCIVARHRGSSPTRVLSHICTSIINCVLKANVPVKRQWFLNRFRFNRSARRLFHVEQSTLKAANLLLGVRFRNRVLPLD